MPADSVRIKQLMYKMTMKFELKSFYKRETV